MGSRIGVTRAQRRIFSRLTMKPPKEPPLESHPIQARALGEGRLWIYKRYCPPHIRCTQRPSIILEDSFKETPHQKLHLVSNASVHIGARQAAGAWSLFNSHELHR